MSVGEYWCVCASLQMCVPVGACVYVRLCVFLRCVHVSRVCVCVCVCVTLTATGVSFSEHACFHVNVSVYERCVSLSTCVCVCVCLSLVCVSPSLAWRPAWLCVCLLCLPHPALRSLRCSPAGLCPGQHLGVHPPFLPSLQRELCPRPGPV